MQIFKQNKSFSRCACRIWIKNLKFFSDLKAEKAKDEAELRNRQNKVEELKAKESQIKG